MKTIVNLMAVAAMSLLAACSNSDMPNDIEEMRQQPIQVASRISDGSFQPGDKLGVYISMYENGKPTELKGFRNYLDNGLFRYRQGVWTPDKEIFWQDNQTMADFYAYFPYTEIKTSNNVVFNVLSNQQKKSDYESSDFLWCKTAAQRPSNAFVNFEMKHLMSKAVVKLKAGKGFRQEELSDSYANIYFINIFRSASISIGEGSVHPIGELETIVPYHVTDYTYEALLIPQHVQTSKLIEVRVKDDTFYLTKSIDFEPGKQYTLTVTVSRSNSGINVSVSNWEIVPGDFGGEALE